MRKLMLLLIAFIAVVTFIRAYDKSDTVILDDLSRQTAIEAVHTNR